MVLVLAMGDLFFFVTVFLIQKKIYGISKSFFENLNERKLFAFLNCTVRENEKSKSTSLLVYVRFHIQNKKQLFL